MQNLILITSIIKTPNKPLSYINTRSIFSPQERFEQTKNTIKTVKEKIPNSKIMIVECSELSDEEQQYFENNSDYFLNLINNRDAVDKIYSKSKSLGEGTMTIFALNFIKNNNIEFNNFFKISGRYFLSNNFHYNNFENDDIIVHYIDGDLNNCCTALYKLHKSNINNFLIFLESNVNLMIDCIGYERLFSIFLKNNVSNKIVNLDKIGINGCISVSTDFINT